MTSLEKRKARQKRYYEKNKERLKKEKLERYYKNKEKALATMKIYREKFIKPFTGKKGKGNYNITLAERNKTKWLKEYIFLYKLEIIDINNQKFYKYGLTKNIKNRLYQIPYDVKIVDIYKMNKYEAIYKERDLLKNEIKYKPLKKFGGHTECFL